jgi:hypothetical protein
LGLNDLAMETRGSRETLGFAGIRANVNEAEAGERR